MHKFIVSALALALSASAFAAEPVAPTSNAPVAEEGAADATSGTSLATETGVLGGVSTTTAVGVGVAAAAGIAAAASGGGGGGGGGNGGTTGTTGTTGTN